MFHDAAEKTVSSVRRDLHMGLIIKKKVNGGHDLPGQNAPFNEQRSQILCEGAFCATSSNAPSTPH